MSPIRIALNTPNDPLQSIFNEIGTILLKENADTTIVIPRIDDSDQEISYRIAFGNPFRDVEPTPIELPFPDGREYLIIQGNNTNYTHNNDYSRYAIDFSLSVGDTIASSSDGFVVGVIDDYSRGGKESKWRPYSNYITIYDPKSGLYFQYVHLNHKGSFVVVGDSVSSGQPIGIVGMTGQTNVPHLHFNVLIPSISNEGIKSIPVEFVEGYIGTELKKGDIVRK